MNRDGVETLLFISDYRRNYKTLAFTEGRGALAGVGRMIKKELGNRALLLYHICIFTFTQPVVVTLVCPLLCLLIQSGYNGLDYNAVHAIPRYATLSENP